MDGIRTAAPLAETDRDDEQKISLLGSPNKPVTIDREMDEEEEAAAVVATVDKDSPVSDDDDEILNLHTKLAASSPNKRPLLDDDADAPIAALVPTPPDGGWGWVIVFASFMANLVVDGIAYSFGLLMPEFKNAFPGSDDSTVALIGSMLCGMYLLVGPVVSGLVNTFGARKVMIAGSLISTVGFFISVWSPSVILLMLSYGIIGGIGFGLIYLPACIYVGYYFEKRRALATGIAVAGSGFGTFVFAPLSVALMDTFGWQGSLWIFAGLILNCAVFGMLMRPLPKPKALEEWVEKKQSLQKASSKMSGLADANSDWTLSYYQQDGGGRQRRITLQTQGSQQSHVSGFQSPPEAPRNAAAAASTSTTAGTTTTTSDIQRTRSGLSETSDSGLPISPSVQQSALEQVEEEPEPEQPPSVESASPNAIKGGQRSPPSSSDEKSKSSTTTSSPIAIEGPARKEDAFRKPRERGNSIRSNSPSSVATSGLETNIAVGGHQHSSSSNLPIQLQLPGGSPSTTEIRPQLSRAVSRSSRISIHNYTTSMQRLASSAGGTGSQQLSARSYQSLAAIDPSEFSRPFSRQDILYPGSVQKLPEYKKSQSNLTKYRESIISIPQAVELYEADGRGVPGGVISVPIQDETPGACEWLPSGVRHTLMSMIDLNLLKSPVMVFLSVSNIFAMLGFYVPFVFLTNFAESLGVSKGESSLLLSVIGITNTVGRVVFGAVCDRGWVKALTVNNFCLLSCGALTLLVPFLRTYSLLMVYSVVFGFLISAYISLTAIILVDYMGLHNLTNAFGLIILFRGISSMAGSPLAGAVAGNSEPKVYDAAFYFAGVLIIVGGLISLAIPFVDRWWRKRYGLDAEEEINGKTINLMDEANRIDELDEIMAELATKESQSPSPGRSASQTLTPNREHRD